MSEPQVDQRSTTRSRPGPIPHEFAWVLLLALILVVGLFVASNWPYAIHKNDPTAFAERSRPLLQGSLPYLDYEFEHLPLAIVPMALAAVLEELLGGVHYTLLFWLIMGGILVGIGCLTEGLGKRLGVADGALRWVLISFALLPLIAFRVDALSVLLILLAVTWAMDGRSRDSAWATGAAIAVKGWPIVLAVIDWWRGARQRAIVTVGATLAGVAVLTMFPLFRSGREFFGVHIETVTGAAIALVRTVRGLPTEVGVAAGASYVEVGSWAVATNLLIGAGLGLLGLRVLTKPFTWQRAVDLIGVLTIAVMLVSPLLSAQFIIWITPFAAVTTNRRVRIGAASAAFLTGVFVTFWYIESSWWWAVIVARNGFLLWTGWVWVQGLLREQPDRSPASHPSLHA
jgi:hypothetical protein